MNGGYVLLDCKGLELTTATGQTIAGMHQRITDTIGAGKPFYACNCTFEGDVMTPVAVMITPRSGGTYIATASTLQIVIGTDDSIEIINMIE